MHVHAHTRLLESQPANGATVDHTPEAVVLHFAAPVETGFNKVELYADGRWQPLLVDGLGTRLQAHLPPLTSGRYKIRWSVLSSDGHRQNGTLVFVIR